MSILLSITLITLPHFQSYSHNEPTKIAEMDNAQPSQDGINEESLQKVKTQQVKVQPTLTPTPIPKIYPKTVLNVRSGPGTNYPIIGKVFPGSAYRITGKNAAQTWWRIDYNGRYGWVYASLTSTAGNTTAIKIIPTPRPPANPNPTFTPTPAPLLPPPRFTSFSGEDIVTAYWKWDCIYYGWELESEPECTRGEKLELGPNDWFVLYIPGFRTYVTKKYFMPFPTPNWQWCAHIHVGRFNGNPQTGGKEVQRISGESYRCP